MYKKIGKNKHEINKTIYQLKLENNIITRNEKELANESITANLERSSVA